MNVAGIHTVIFWVAYFVTVLFGCFMVDVEMESFLIVTVIREVSDLVNDIWYEERFIGLHK